FSVMIGYVEGGRVGAGVVYEPARERLTFARSGGGCWGRAGADQTAQQCRAGTAAEPGGATLTQTHSRRPEIPSAAAALLKPRKVIESYSAGIKLALVARGEADLYV